MQTAEARVLDLQNPIDWLHGLVVADMAAVDRLVHERLGSAVPLIPDLARHLVDSGGKRLRPMLTIAAARLNRYTFMLVVAPLRAPGSSGSLVNPLAMF